MAMAFNDQDQWGLVPPLLECLPFMNVDVDGEPTIITLYSGERLPDETAHDRLMLWRRRVEAMELLALAWIIDLDVWGQLLADKTLGSIRSRQSTGANMPEYEIFFSETNSSELTQSSLDALFTPTCDEERSEGFRAAKASILAQEQRESVLSACEKLQLLVRINPGGDNIDQRSTIVRHFEATRHGPSRCKLASMGYFDPNTISRESIDSLHDQVQRGLPIGPTLMGLLRVETFLTRHVANDLFSDLLGELGANNLQIRHVNRRRETMEAFFSKLVNAHHSSLRSLKLVNFDFGESLAERRSALLWWVHGLFSQDARHSIEHLQYSLDERPSADDFRWLSELLRTHAAPRPELFIADVFDEYVGRESPALDQWLIVPSGYPIRVEHGDGWRDTALVFEDRTMRLRVLRDDPTWSFVDVLVPGYGRCWVERSETVVIQTQPLTKWTLDKHSIRSMDLGLYLANEAETSSACELLALVGRPVEKLRLTRWTSRERIVPTGLDVEFLATIVRSCPRLHELSLGSVPVASAEVLVGLYEHNHCPITTLDLPSGAFVDRTSVLLFLKALGDPTLKISRTLEWLYLDLTGYTTDGQDDDESLVLAVFAMLEGNRFLRSVEIHVSREHFASFGSQFQALRKTLIAVQRTPLSLRAKCAMLSVVRQQIAPLEPGVLASVFEFAAECAIRDVTISAPSARTFS